MEKKRITKRREQKRNSCSRRSGSGEALLPAIGGNLFYDLVRCVLAAAIPVEGNAARQEPTILCRFQRFKDRLLLSEILKPTHTVLWSCHVRTYCADCCVQQSFDEWAEFPGDDPMTTAILGHLIYPVKSPVWPTAAAA